MSFITSHGFPISHCTMLIWRQRNSFSNYSFIISLWTKYLIDSTAKLDASIANWGFYPFGKLKLRRNNIVDKVWNWICAPQNDVQD